MPDAVGPHRVLRSGVGAAVGLGGEGSSIFVARYVCASERKAFHVILNTISQQEVSL